MKWLITWLISLLGPGKQLHIAVDFDGTIVTEQWPAIGPLKFGARWVLRWALLRGHKLILWTCREGQLLKKAKIYLYDRDIMFDAVNDNLPERKEKYGTNSRKIGADMYIDDRAGVIFWPLQFMRILWKELTAK